MAVTVIAAVAGNGVIGNEGRMPWKIAAEMQHFSSTTMNHCVVMGRKTWESLDPSYRPLPNRVNVVVSRSLVKRTAKGIVIVDSLVRAVDLLKKLHPEKEIFIIGGQQIYEEAFRLNIADKLIISRIPGEYDGDSFFPEIRKDIWMPTQYELFDQFSVITYSRTQTNDDYARKGNSVSSNESA